MVTTARAMPLSASVLVARDELLELLQAALDRFPDELRQARWLLRERDEFLATRQREADNLLEEVRAQAERMVQRTEIVRQANHVAQRILDDAREEARRLRHEAEDFCDQKLASFEIVLGPDAQDGPGRAREASGHAAAPARGHRCARRRRRGRGRRRRARVLRSGRRLRPVVSARPFVVHVAKLRRVLGTRWHEVRSGTIDDLACSGSEVPPGAAAPGRRDARSHRRRHQPSPGVVRRRGRGSADGAWRRRRARCGSRSASSTPPTATGRTPIR